MSVLRSIITFLLVTSFSYAIYGQKIGLVLSGGGANGYAHIGVLKALEEHQIPVDYITGTSSGAFIGAMYASGYSVEEIEQILLSEAFDQLIRGELTTNERYFFKQKEPDASMLTLHVSKDLSLSNTLPTNVISTSKVDFELMKLFSKPSAVARYDFDSLMIPFRCVAADIEEKKEFIFAFGNLSTAVRASFTYPFMIKPIEVDKKLLFDGGLYNNFPHDIMTETFNPDFIVGVKVTSNEPSPKSNDLISQVRTMMISKTDFDLQKPGVIIEPITNHGSFDFFELQAIIDSGYAQAIRQIDEIKNATTARRSKEELQQERVKFKSQEKELKYDHKHYYGLTKSQNKYVSKLMKTSKKDSLVDIEKLKTQYYKLNADPRIESLYPSSSYDKNTGNYKLHLKVNRQKPLHIDLGGNVSNRPISTGYVGLRYTPFLSPSFEIKANTYFGRFYNSGLLSTKVDFASRLPISLEATMAFNSWNYFTSKSFFFEDQKPPYLIKTETFAKLEMHVPVSIYSKLSTQIGYDFYQDRYYQDQEFNSQDLPDETTTTPFFTGLRYEFNTQNRILYATQGTKIVLRGSYASGNESTKPGTTAFDSTIVEKHHEWFDFKASFDVFYKSNGKLRLGILGEGVYSDQDLFANYTASILRSPSFEPLPESKTLFLESFRAYQYVGIGHKFVYNIWRNLDLRAEAYFLFPYKKVIRNLDGSQSFQEGFKDQNSMFTGGAVYHTPVGPLSLSVNYYYNAPEVNPENEQVTFLFHFGYIIFNKKGID